MLPGQGGPSGEGHHFHFVKVVGPEMVSLPGASAHSGFFWKRGAFPSSQRGSKGYSLKVLFS